MPDDLVLFLYTTLFTIILLLTVEDVILRFNQENDDEL